MHFLETLIENVEEVFPTLLNSDVETGYEEGGRLSDTGETCVTSPPPPFCGGGGVGGGCGRGRTSGHCIVCGEGERGKERVQARWRRESQLRLNEFWKVTCIHIFPFVPTEHETLAMPEDCSILFKDIMDFMPA